MTSAEYAEWLAYDRLEPMTEERADWRAGMIAATLANVYREKGAEPLKPDDFMPKWGGSEPERPSAEEVFAKLQRWADAHNAHNDQRAKWRRLKA